MLTRKRLLSGKRLLPWECLLTWELLCRKRLSREGLWSGTSWSRSGGLGNWSFGSLRNGACRLRLGPCGCAIYGKWLFAKWARYCLANQMILRCELCTAATCYLYRHRNPPACPRACVLPYRSTDCVRSKHLCIINRDQKSYVKRFRAD